MKQRNRKKLNEHVTLLNTLEKHIRTYANNVFQTRLPRLVIPASDELLCDTVWRKPLAIRTPIHQVVQVTVHSSLWRSGGSGKCEWDGGVLRASDGCTQRINVKSTAEFFRISFINCLLSSGFLFEKAGSWLLGALLCDNYGSEANIIILTVQIITTSYAPNKNWQNKFKQTWQSLFEKWPTQVTRNRDGELITFSTSGSDIITSS